MALPSNGGSFEFEFLGSVQCLFMDVTETDTVHRLASYIIIVTDSYRMNQLSQN